VLTFWIAYVLTRPLGASLGDLLTQDRQFGGLALGASVTSLLFFAVILVLVTREQVLTGRHGITAKGDEPAGGRRSDYAWAGAAVVVLAAAGWALSGTPTPSNSAELTTATSTTSAKAAHPTTRLGDLSAFTVIATDVKAKVDHNDLTGGRTKVKDLEVAWDNAESGLKPRDPAKWHQLDGEIDTVLTSLRAGSPTQLDCEAGLKTLISTLNTYNGV
jgi:hypothetical protein